MRIPIRISYLLKKSFYSQEQRLEHPFHPRERASVMSTIDNFMSGYYGIRLFLTTPIPFPLVQMSRTFLFAYVFTIPFCLLDDNSSAFAHCCQVFFMTFGFVGLELVAIELDNPFGDDENVSKPSAQSTWLEANSSHTALLLSITL